MYSIYAFIHQTTLRKAQVVQLQRWKSCCPELNYTTLHCTTLQTYDSNCCVAMYLIYGILWIDRYIYICTDMYKYMYNHVYLYDTISCSTVLFPNLLPRIKPGFTTSTIRGAPTTIEHTTISRGVSTLP